MGSCSADAVTFRTPPEPPQTSGPLFRLTPGNSGPDVFGNVTSLGHNLIGSVDSSIVWDPSDLTGVDPHLAPLADNGGATQTMALLPGSPAINAGSNDLIPPGVTTDQRYFARIVGGVVDIGAYEANAETPSVSANWKLGSLLRQPSWSRPKPRWRALPRSGLSSASAS